MPDFTTLRASIGRDHYQTRLDNGRHQFLGDEPADAGGTDTGPTPSELVLAGLATCTAATLRMYADRKGWDLEKIDLVLTLEIEKNGAIQVGHIRRNLTLHGNLSEDERKRLLDIAEKCPVHRLLTNEVRIETTLS